MFKIPQEDLVGLKIKSYNFVKVIGQGNYGIVYQAFNDNTFEAVAVKVVPKQLFKRTPKLLELVKTEIRVLKECKNDNVVRFVDNFMTEKSIVIVMELCEGGELQEYLTNKGRLTQSEATTYLKQIINGFKGLHEVDAMHRDFKAANVLLHQNVCKIADLGFAKQVKEEGLTTTLLGTGLTMAPEVHQQKAYGRKADIWSVGIVFYQLIYGDYPFKGFSDIDIIKSIKNTRPNYQKVNISEKAKDFIERCLTVDPKKRISWKEVYSHPLIVQEQNIKYGTTSSIKLIQNQVFYDRDSTPEGYEVPQMFELEILEEKVINADIELQKKLVVQSEERNKIETAIMQYQTLYLNRRNNIMFIFKYIIPSVTAVYKNIHANHSITLFIMCKKAYQDIKLFYAQLASKKNFLFIKSYFEQFIFSKQYKEIGELLQNDVTLIRIQTDQYSHILPQNINEFTKRELQIDHIYHPNWLKFVMEIVDSYENEIIDNLDSIPQNLKKTVINLVQGLHYYKQHGEDSKIQAFAKRIQGLCYEQAEIMLRQQLVKKLTEYQ